MTQKIAHKNTFVSAPKNKIKLKIKNKKSAISKENEMGKSQAFLVMKKHPRIKNFENVQ